MYKLDQLQVREEEELKDDLFWSLSLDGVFSVKLAYEIIKGTPLCNLNDRWSMIWKLKVPQPINVLMVGTP